jgi:hypothetical protein
MGLAIQGTVRKRFWKVGGLLAAFILTLTVANFFLPPDKAFDRHMYGHDFLPFYTAGQLIRTGQADHLYDPRATRALEHQTCQAAGLVIHNEYGAFLNPPFAALPAAWLAQWAYPRALAIWTVILAAFFITSVVLLVKMLPPRSPWQNWGLVPLLLFTFLPAWQAALHAQNTFFSLMILAATVTLWRREKPLAAGLIAGLLLFKPQLGAVVAVVLAASLGRRAIAGTIVTAAVLLLAGMIELPGALGAYLHQMPANLRAIQVLANYTWHRHVTFLAAFRMLLQGHAGALPNLAARWLAFGCMIGLGALLARTIRRERNNSPARDRLIAAAIAAGPLLMPYYMDYDLTLLAVAAVICAADAMRNGIDRAVGAAWIVFYCAAELNPLIAGATRIIPAVPALTILAVVLIRKASQPAAAQIQQPESIQQLALAA